MTASLHPTDLLQVTIQSCGKIIKTLTLSGLSSLNEVLRQVMASISSTAVGIVTVSLRNRTQGWLVHHNIVASQPLRSPTLHHNAIAAPLPSLFSINPRRAGA